MKKVEDWNKLAVTLEREDKEFRRVMEAEVSIVYFSKFNNEYRTLAVVDIIAQHQIGLPIFKQFLALLT